MKTAKLAMVLIVALSFARCGGTKPEEKAATPPVTVPVQYFHVDPASAGKVHGKITFRGSAPAKQVISMESEAGCQQAHGGRPVYDESIVIGNGAGLANAFVYIQSGLEGKKFEPPKESVRLDQHGCLFAPRAIGIQTGQVLDVKNSDSVSHNIHPMPKENREWNQQQSPQSPDLEHKFPRPEIMIPVKCNVHSWMHAYIGVVDHPYFTVTGSDGSFELTNVPPGDYTIAVWHEKLGDQTKQVHVAASASAAADFTFR